MQLEAVITPLIAFDFEIFCRHSNLSSLLKLHRRKKSNDLQGLIVRVYRQGQADPQNISKIIKRTKW